MAANLPESLEPFHLVQGCRSSGAWCQVHDKDGVPGCWAEGSGQKRAIMGPGTAILSTPGPKEQSMPTYLITGVAGFIGSAIARELVQRGETVRGLDDFSTGKRENIADF